MIRSTITDPRLNAPFHKAQSVGFQVCPRPKLFRTDQLLLVLLAAVVVLGGLVSLLGRAL